MTIRKKAISVILMISLLLGILFTLSSLVRNGVKQDSFENTFGYKISFPQPADATITKDTEMVYDINLLKAQIQQDTAFVYHNPILTDYSIVTKFGFDVDEYTMWDDNRRFYSTDGRDSKKTLLIDQYGCFSYDTGVKDTFFEMTLSDLECERIAGNTLSQYGLFNDRIGKRRSIDETSLMNSDFEEKVVGKGVNFLAEVGDEFDNDGNARVSVDINGNGEATRIMYHLREYSQVVEVDLISIEQAIDFLKNDSVYLDIETPSVKLEFNKVSLSYWSQEINPENLMIQPVYVFEGISTTNSGDTEQFAIVVQANALG